MAAPVQCTLADLCCCFIRVCCGFSFHFNACCRSFVDLLYMCMHICICAYATVEAVCWQRATILFVVWHISNENENLLPQISNKNQQQKVYKELLKQQKQNQWTAQNNKNDNINFIVVVRAFAATQVQTQECHIPSSYKAAAMKTDSKFSASFPLAILAQTHMNFFITLYCSMTKASWHHLTNVMPLQVQRPRLRLAIVLMMVCLFGVNALCLKCEWTANTWKRSRKQIHTYQFILQGCPANGLWPGGNHHNIIASISNSSLLLF